MPIALSGLDVTNIVIANPGATPWTVTFYAVTGGNILGSRIVGDVYVDGDELSVAEAIRIRIVDTPDTYAGLDTTTITLTIDSNTVVILPQSNIGVGTTYYLDTNGVLYTDYALTIPFHSQGETEEGLYIAESNEDDFVGETLESLILAEVNAQDDPEQETEETLTLSEDINIVSEVSSVDGIGFLEDIITKIGDAWTERTPGSVNTWSER